MIVFSDSNIGNLELYSSSKSFKKRMKIEHPASTAVSRLTYITFQLSWENILLNIVNELSRLFAELKINVPANNTYTMLDIKI